MKARLKVLVSGLWFAVIATGCSTMETEPVDYKNAKSLPPLEMPPDLLTPSLGPNALPLNESIEEARTFSEYNSGLQSNQSQPQNDAAAVLAKTEQVRLAKDGAIYWLNVKGDTGPVWNAVKQFLQDNNFTLKREDSTLGVLETEWTGSSTPPDSTAESSKSLDALHAASTRDRYIVHIESGAVAGSTDIYISHNGMQQVALNGSTTWLPRPNEPVLELEMLKRLAIAFGMPESQAKDLGNDEKVESRATLVRDNQNNFSLRVAEDFPRTWRRLTVVLDRLGVNVEDYDRSKGIFFIKGNGFAKDEEKGWLTRLFGGDAEAKEDERKNFQLQLKEEGDTTIITVLDEDGKNDNSKSAEKLLENIHNQFK